MGWNCCVWLLPPEIIGRKYGDAGWNGKFLIFAVSMGGAQMIVAALQGSFVVERKQHRLYMGSCRVQFNVQMWILNGSVRGRVSSSRTRFWTLLNLNSEVSTPKILLFSHWFVMQIGWTAFTA